MTHSRPWPAWKYIGAVVFIVSQAPSVATGAGKPEWTRTIGYQATSATEQRTTTAQKTKKTVWEGIYTPEQADRGREAYERACAHCHRYDLSGDEEAPALRGSSFFVRWDGRSVSEMFGTVAATMPQDSPASLSSETYVDIMSFLLKQNLVPAGDVELPADIEKLEQLLIRAPTDR